jgi:flavin-dependent dehydrogenase
VYDVIVVGGRCAGSPTAMLLARRGHRVLLLEKARFPKDTVSTLLIHQPGLARLQAWGLIDRLRASGCPPVHRMTWNLEGLRLSGSAPPADGVAEVYCPRRTVLDPILADAAAEAGVEVRQGFAVKELVFEDGRVVGTRGRESGGAIVGDRASIVVGADGLRSLVARSVDASRYNERPPLTSQLYSFYSGIPTDGVEIFVGGDRSGTALIPTNDGLTLVAAGWALTRTWDPSITPEDRHTAILGERPDVAERVAAGRREERVFGMANIPNFFRTSHGAGWALVGDAGYHKDPITAEGITDAFRDVELLVEAVDAGLSGRTPMDQALASHEQLRNEFAMPLYEFTCNIASMEPLDARTNVLFQAISRSQEHTDRFLGIAGGAVHPFEFFSAENVARVLADAQSSEARSAENASMS